MGGEIPVSIAKPGDQVVGAPVLPQNQPGSSSIIEPSSKTKGGLKLKP
jgi:hypothetical protein